MDIYIINPDNLEPIPVEEWKKESDPTKAKFVAIRVNGGVLLIRKEYLPGSYEFEEAQKACADLAPIYNDHFRCPTRKECIDIYDARFQGLDEALELVGGDPISGYFWTCERDMDPRSIVSSAWFFYGTHGNLTINNVYSAYKARAVALLSVLW